MTTHAELSHTRFVLRALVLSILLSWFASGSAWAEPVLYRISSLTGSSFLSGQPASVHPPMTIPSSAPKTASVITNGTAPASVKFQAGDIVYDNRFVNPSPATAFGLFYSSQGWKLDNLAGTLGPNPSAVTSSAQPDGFPSAPPFFSSTAPQPSATALIRVKPGPNKFGGAWDLGHTYDSLLVVAKVAGGFTAGRVLTPNAGGKSATISNFTGNIERWHSTTNFVTPAFSSTQCPATPASCPWAGSTTPQQVEETGVRWTTGMVTVVNVLPPVTFLPPTGTLIDTGADNRSGPMSSMGTLQLVSGHNAYSRGAFPVAGNLNQWDMTLTFLPEPGGTLLLGAGIGGLLALRTVRRRGR